MKTLLLFLLLFSPLLAIANEEQLAKNACMRVMQNHCDKTNQAISSFSFICDVGDRPTSYWECIESRMLTDERLQFAMSMCERADK